MTTSLDLYTTGDAAKRLNVPRHVVAHAIERDAIEPVARAGIVRLFSAKQWPEIVKAVRVLQSRRRQ